MRLFSIMADLDENTPASTDTLLLFTVIIGSCTRYFWATLYNKNERYNYLNQFVTSNSKIEYNNFDIIKNVAYAVMNADADKIKSTQT